MEDQRGQYWGNELNYCEIKRVAQVAPNTAIAGRAPRQVSLQTSITKLGFFRIVPSYSNGNLSRNAPPPVQNICLGNLLNAHLYAKVARSQSFMHLARTPLLLLLAGAEMRAGQLWCSRSLWDSSPGPIWPQKARWWGRCLRAPQNCMTTEVLF